MISYTFKIHRTSDWSPFAVPAKTNNKVRSPGSNKRRRAKRFTRTRGHRL